MAYQAHRNDIDEEDKQAQEQRNVQNNANTIRNAAKVAEHAGGWAAAAGAAVDTADKLTGGKSSEVLGKALNSATKVMPNGKAIQDASNKLAESGMGDKIGAAADATKGATGTPDQAPTVGAKVENAPTGAPPTSTEIGKNKNEVPGFGKFENDNTKKPTSNGPVEKEEENPDETENDATMQTQEVSKGLKFLALALMASILLVFMPLIVALTVYTSIGDVAKDFISNIGNSFIGFFTGEQATSEEAFYKELDTVRKKIKREDGVCIDINLIIAALTVDTDFEQMLEEGNEEIIDADSSDGEQKYTQRMKKQVALLGAMQVKHKYYSLDASADTKCKNNSKIVPVDSSNKGDFTLDIADWLSGRDPNSETPRLIANNDKDSYHFFDKAVKNEKNYAYYIYYPEYDDDDSCSNSYAKDKLEEMNDDEGAELDIGDLSTMKDSVFYWNLVDQFIPDYYAEYLPKEEGEERNAAIEKIADDIYALYESMGPNQSCNNIDSSNLTYTNSSLCPDGIMVEDADGNISVYELEEYVAGVIQHEAYTSEGIEALKAQAVAARTYALNKTGYCTGTIKNSTTAQTFSTNPGENAKEAAAATAGEIMKYNGNVFSAQYDSFCYADGDCPDSIKNSDNTYTVTYTRVPSSETHKITLSDTSQYGRILSGQGHAHGMSQLVSYQMAKEGKNYHEILEYFYADGTETIREGIGGFVGDWVNWRQGDPLWGSRTLGSSGTTVREAGCYLTTTAMVLAKYGVTGIDGVPLNPGTLVDFYNDSSHLGFTSSNCPACLNSPGVVVGHTDGNSISKFSIYTDYDISAEHIYDLLTQGKVIVVQMNKTGRYSTHFMLIDTVINGVIYLHDPAGVVTTFDEMMNLSYYVSAELKVYTLG